MVVPPAVIAACAEVGAGFTVTVIALDVVVPQVLLTSHVYEPADDAVKL